MSRDIILVSSGYDMNIRFWSHFNDSKCKHSIEYKEAAINSLEITPNKEYVAFTSQNSIKFINLKTLNSTPVLSIDSHEGIVSSILFPIDFESCFISAGEDYTARINDIRIGKSVKEFYHTNNVNSVCIANNNRELIAADENGTIKVWDINKGELRTEYNSNSEEEGQAFRSIAVSDKGGFVVGAKSSGKCCVFDYNKDKEIKLLNSFEAHKMYITKCILSPEHNYLATCSADSEIRLWERGGDSVVAEADDAGSFDSKEFKLKSRFIGHKKWVWDCEFSLDSKYLISCSTDKYIRVWSLSNGKVLSSIINPKGINNVALVDDDLD